MEEDQKRIRNFLISTIREISDEKFQEKVWLLGKGPEISSVGELFCNFFDDLDIQEIFENYKKYQISRLQLKLLKELYDQLDEYDKLIPVTPIAKEVITDPNWHKIRNFAKKVYTELTKNPPFQN